MRPFVAISGVSGQEAWGRRVSMGIFTLRIGIRVYGLGRVDCLESRAHAQ